MRHLLTLLILAASAFGQTATISDTIRTPFNGTFSGTVTVSLNSPALAQPLYSGNVTLSGWTQTVTVTAGVFTLTLYTNDLITPGGTSYTATYAPTSGSGWKETWIVPTGATTIREIRSTTVPSPSVRFTPSQITQAGATLGQGLKWDGSKWAPADVVANPMTTNGDLITRLGGVPVRVGIGSTNQVLTVSGGMPVWASGITGNASTATALAADPANCGAGTLPRGVDASGAGQNCAAVALASEVTGTLPNANTTAASANTASAIVARDASGNFAAGTVTAALTGNASTATALQTARTIAGTSFDGTANIAIASTGLSDSANLVRNNAANTYTAGSKQTFASNATTAGAAFGGGITADPSSVTAGDFWYRTDLGTFGFRNASAVDALVAGGRALSTVGSVPFVTAAGVLGQDAGVFTYDATSDLLAIRRSAANSVASNADIPARAALITRGSSVLGGNPSIALFSTPNGSAIAAFFESTLAGSPLSLQPYGGNLLLGTTTDDGTSRLQVNGNLIVNGGNALRLQNAAGNQFASMLLNANSIVTVNYPFSVGPNSALTSAVTFGVHDGTPTTGSTSLVVRAGAGQGSNNLTTWQNSGGATLAFTSNAGVFRAPGFGDVGEGTNLDANGLYMKSAGVVRFTNGAFAYSTPDLSLSRASANTLQVGDGSANSNGTIVARIYTWANGTEGTCDATLRGQVVMVQGGAGVADTFRVCRKDAANVYAWTALY